MTHRLHTDVSEGQLLIQYTGDHAGAMELRITGEAPWPGSAVSPNAPKGWKATNHRFVWEGGDRELWFMTVSVDPTDFEAVVELEGDTSGGTSGGTCIWNSPLIDVTAPAAAELVFPAPTIQHWENNLFIKNCKARVKGFYLRRTVVKHETTVTLLDPTFAGRVSVHDARGAELAAAQVMPATSPSVSPLKLPDDKLPGRDVLIEGLRRLLEHLLASQDTRDGSMTEGGFSLIYDSDAKCFRAPHWMWAWGPAIQLLLRAAEVDGLGIDPQRLRDAANACGEASLRFIEVDAAHPAHDICRVRWEPTSHAEHGYAEYISPSDSLFLSGWGWIPLYEATGDERYLDAAKKLAQACDRIAKEHGIVPQDWETERDAWSPHLYDESSFGMDGYTELYRVTGDEQYKQGGLLFMQQLLDRFNRGDGLWHRLIYINREKPDEDDIDTKGEGWVHAGLEAMYRMTQSPEDLKKITAMADHLLRAQKPDGHWNWRFTDTPGDTVSDRTIGIWAYLMYRMHTITGRDDYRDSAERALRWCLANQYHGPDPLAIGSIQVQAGFLHWNFVHMSVIYTTTYVGLAILEALKQAE